MKKYKMPTAAEGQKAQAEADRTPANYSHYHDESSYVVQVRQEINRVGVEIAVWRPAYLGQPSNPVEYVVITERIGTNRAEFRPLETDRAVVRKLARGLNATPDYKSRGGGNY